MHKLLNSVWNKKELPDVWMSIIVSNYKESYKTDCSNYGRIALLLVSYKHESNILLSRLSPYIDAITGDHQCGYRLKRSTTDQIFPFP
jgi:hypothetical protein